ncbi:cuticle protein 12.5-like [Photinus pyralis]|uniref:cuticle protein 12.5-like n=1 Tax=Photinus pyralis TaxID=7054 RepID=UPI001266F2DA|nr:cuticle protein 12.5-like [Photinus pyralis]
MELEAVVTLYRDINRQSSNEKLSFIGVQSTNNVRKMFQFVVLFAAVAAAKAGLLEGGLRYAAPAPIGLAAPAPIAYAAPTPIAYAAPAPVALPAPALPAISRIEHLGPAVVSSYKTDVAVAPQQRTYEIQPATVHHAPVLAAPAPVYTAATPLIATAPLIRGDGYFGHGLGYSGAHFGGSLGYATGYAGAHFGGSLGYATGYAGGYLGRIASPYGFSKYGHY